MAETWELYEAEVNRPVLPASPLLSPTCVWWKQPPLLGIVGGFLPGTLVGRLLLRKAALSLNETVAAADIGLVRCGWHLAKHFSCLSPSWHP